MWFSNAVTCLSLIFLYLTHMSRVLVAAQQPCPNFTSPNWNFLHTPPPARLTQKWIESKNVIDVKVTDITGQHCLVVVVVPITKGRNSTCPPNLEKSMDMRRSKTYMLKNFTDVPELSLSFGFIFPGCYYFMMVSFDLQEMWQLSPVFYNTSYLLLDSKVTLQKNITPPKDSNNNGSLITVFRIPLQCISLTVKFFAQNGSASAADFVQEVESTGLIEPRFPEYRIQKFKGNDKPNITPSRITDIEPEVIDTIKIPESVDGYTVKVKWRNLKSRPWHYCLYYYSNNVDCFDDPETRDVDVWLLLEPKHVEYIGFIGDSNYDTSSKSDSVKKWVILSSVMFVVVMILILAIWMVKCVRLMKARNIVEASNFYGTTEVTLIDNRVECNRIMLIYLQGSLSFMETMKTLRDDLERACHCDVHDIFAPEEWASISELGAYGWVEKLMTSGSKIVWVDTPQFRERLNDLKMKQSDGDPRELAVPHAVFQAIDLFANSNTQYRWHFIVRMMDLEIENDHADPLLLISSRTRYHLPQNFDQLCEDLIGPTVRMDIEGSNAV